MIDLREKYLNGPQLRSALMFTNVEVNLLSRGVGKTEGVIAPRSERLVHLMPGSVGAFVTKTFRQALTNTLPPVVRGWARLGYIEGIHFVIGQRPPTHFKQNESKPLEWKYTISWVNGSIIHLISQDRPGSANGLSIDWVIVDEAKFIDKEKFDAEIVPANRGNREMFGHLSCHHSIMYCTDRWYGPEASWIDELEEQVTGNKNKLIEVLAVDLEKLKMMMIKNEYSSSYLEKLEKKKRSLEIQLNELRKDAVYFNYASAIENITVLGVDYLKKQEEALPMSMLLVTVYNERRRLSQTPFYPHLDRKKLCYNTEDNGWLEYGRKYINCNADQDFDPSRPIYVTIDPGAVINTLVVAQIPEPGKYKIINSFHVKSPAMTSDVVNKLCDYYGPWAMKKAIVYFNQTHVAKHGATPFTYKSVILDAFKKKGWTVADVYFPVVMSAEERYELIARLMKQGQLTFNEMNCEFLLISMEDADTKEERGMLKKDKKSEKNSSGVAPEKATHFSDALDDLVVGMIKEPSPHFNTNDMQIMVG